MSKQLKSLLIVVPISFFLLGLNVFLYFLDTEFEPNAYMILSMILTSIWAFFIVPSLPYTIDWAKNYFNNLSFEQGFHLGYLLGRGWGVLAVILFLIASPFTGTMWFIQTIKAMKTSIKTNRNTTPDTNDIFDL